VVSRLPIGRGISIRSLRNLKVTRLRRRMASGRVTWQLAWLNNVLVSRLSLLTGSGTAGLGSWLCSELGSRLRSLMLVHHVYLLLMLELLLQSHLSIRLLLLENLHSRLQLGVRLASLMRMLARLLADGLLVLLLLGLL